VRQAVVRTLAVWGLLDCAWLAIDPAGWARSWGRVISGFRGHKAIARGVAASRAAICVGLLLFG